MKLSGGKTDGPTVDVIIPTYKRPVEIVKRALDSVVNQTYGNWSVALVNDCPGDDALGKKLENLVSSYEDARISYYSYEKNMGACYARNFGASHGEGEFIAFLDDDDCWKPEKLEKQLKKLSDRETGSVYCPFVNYGENSSGKTVVLGNCEGKITDKLLASNKMGGCSMVMVRRTLFEQVGGFDVDLPALQDIDLWIRLSLITKVAFEKEPLVVRYVGDDSISVNFDKKYKGWNMLFNKHKDLFERFPDAFRTRLKNTYLQSMRLGHRKEAMEFWKRYCDVMPGKKKDIKCFLRGWITFFRCGFSSGKVEKR